MEINQAFTILQTAGGIRAARIITENIKHPSKIRVLWMAHLLRRGVPVAKIIHQKWFYGIKFYTNRHTLDPRPDTETLVSAVLKDAHNNQSPKILDLGTGTGCIICALVKNLGDASGVAVDKSRRALRVARKNIRDLQLTARIKTVRASFDFPYNFNQKFDIIVSNPPYIAPNDTRVDIGATHDPAMALYAPDNGLAAYKSIAQNAIQWLADGGKIYLEIGIDQGPDIKDIFIRHGWNLVRSARDLMDIERVLVFERAH